jgi:bacterioferritin-associated ferredoxin
MNIETVFVLAAVTLAAVYLGRDALKGLFAKGGCASGCGSCPSQSCALKKLSGSQNPGVPFPPTHRSR